MAREALSAAVETGENRFEWCFERADGDRRRVDVSLKRAAFEGAERLIAFVRDVTEQRATTDRLRDSREALRQLHDVTMTDESVEAKIARMLEIGTDLLDLQYAYVTEIDDGRQLIRQSRGGHDELTPGATAPRSETYCRRTLDGEGTDSAVTNASAEMGDDPAYQRFGLECYLGETVTVDGEAFGTVCFADDEPRDRAFSEAERMFVDVMARWVGTELEDAQWTRELEARQRQLEAVFDTPGAFVGLLRPDGTLIRANEAAWEFVDRDPETFVGEPFWEGPWFTHDSDLQDRIERCIEVARTGETAEFEATHFSADGRAIDVEGTIRPVRDADGDVDMLVAHGTDVTTRKRRLQQVERHRERLGTILDNAPLVLFVIDQDGVFTESRGAGLEALGLEPGEAVGASIFELYDGHPEILAGVERSLDGETVETKVEIAGKSFHSYLEPVTDDDGSVREVIGVSQDVSELETRERELQAWKDRLQTVIENAPVVLFSYDPGGTVTMSQGKGLSAYGLEPGELVGQNLLDVYDGEPTVQEDIRRAASGESITTTRDIGDVIFKTWYRPIERDGEVEQVIGVTIDITQQKRQERRIAAMSDATNALIDARSPEAVGETVMRIVEDVLDSPMSGIWTYDDEHDVLEPLAATERVREQMDAEDASEALPTITDGTAEMDAFEEGGMHVVEEYTQLAEPAHPDAPLGTVAFVSLGEYGQLHVGSPDADPLTDANRYLISILADNAKAALERAEREQELAEYRQELERSNESLQQFAYIASHDLQEPLRMVSSYVDLLESEYGDRLDDEAEEYMAFAVDGAQRMQAMIEALLEYSRVQTQGEAVTPTDADAVLAETIQDLGLLIDESGAEIETDALPTVQADRSQLSQVFQNLLENAIEHGGEPPQIEVTAVERDGAYEFAVTDDGPGIPPDDQETIFEIFKSGHRGSESTGGTGIGLAVCRRIVHRHGGDIWVDSDPGAGATFRFTIPTTDDSVHIEP